MAIKSGAIYKVRDDLIRKRKEQIQASKYHTTINSNHMCAVLDQTGVPISYGTNIFNIRMPTTEHAEAQALRKLMERLGKTTKKIKIDIIVVRTNGQNSKPCDRCIKRMHELSNRFVIRYVYYTHEEEIDGIRCVKFCKLIEDPDRHYSSYDRHLKRRRKPTNTNNDNDNKNKDKNNNKNKDNDNNNKKNNKENNYICKNKYK